MHDQLTQNKSAGLGCDKKIVATVFGYFVYKSKIDLSKGSKDIDLTFQPYVYPNGNTLGQAIDTVMANVQLQFRPSLEIGQGFSVSPSEQRTLPLNPAYPLPWHWSIQQSWWSSTEEADASITIDIVPASAKGPLITLPVKIKGKPWWWLLPWLWENVLAKPEVSLVLLVFLIIASRKGIGAAWRWMWHRIKKVASGD